MLPKSLRLTRQNFIKTKTSGDFHRYPHFSIIVFKRSVTSYPFNRFSVLVSTKISKSSVVRNGLRRKLYMHLPRLSGLHDLIILPKYTMLKLSDKEIRSQIDNFVSKNLIS